MSGLKKFNLFWKLLFLVIGVVIVFLAVRSNLNKEIKKSQGSTIPPAFPGAEGFGSQTVGGRGGRVIKVTNLNNSGAGSLRDALENQTGPRIVVFDVSGHIVLNSPIIIRNPYVTLAAQTAPGDGVLLRRDQLTIATHDVIVRGLRVRIGDEGPPSNNRDGITISTTYANSDVYNVIVDHSSVSWGIDENFSTWISGSRPYTTRDITISWSIVSEALYDSIHIDEGATAPAPHSMGMMLGDVGATNLSVHHNLLAHNNGRNPRIGGTLNTEVVNNVIYNWGGFPTELPSYITKAHIIGNYYKGGVNSNTFDINFQNNMNSSSRIYINGNFADFGRSRALDSSKTRSPSDDQSAIILRQMGGDTTITRWYTANPPPFKADSKFFNSGLVETDAQTAYTHVLSSAGAFPRDGVDLRIVNDTRNRTGSRINSQNQVGGWSTLRSAPAPTDVDNDGMPDNWEQSRGGNLDPSATASSGYTWIEEYINSLIPVVGGSPVQPPSTVQPTTPSPTPAPTRTFAPTLTPTATPRVTLTPGTSTTSSPSPSPTPLPSQSAPSGNTESGDVNGDGVINIVDIGIIIDSYGASPQKNSRADLNGDGVINIIDIGIVIDNYN